MYASAKLNGFGPLAGIKVVELCEWVAAPAAARCLAEMGAEVIKVENPKGDPERVQAYGFGCQRSDTCDPTYDVVNSNKDWISLNLKTEEGLSILMKLLEDADIFINSMRDRALEKMGLDYETLHARFPRLIWAQMRGYGEFGAMRDEPGYDAVCWGARGGVMGVFRQEGESPAIQPQAFGDLNAAAIFAGGILGALVHQLRTGIGEKVTINLYHVAIWAHSIGLCARQFGAAYPTSRTKVMNPFNDTFQSSDGIWFLICMPDYDRYFDQMMVMLGQDDLVGDATINTLNAVNDGNLQSYVVSKVGEGFATKTYEEWDRILTEQQVPHQKLFDYDDILADQEAYDNDALRSYESTEFGTRTLTTSPIRYGGFGHPPIILSKPIGYHTEPLLKAYGYSDEQIKDFEAAGAISCWHGGEVDDLVH